MQIEALQVAALVAAGWSFDPTQCYGTYHAAAVMTDAVHILTSALQHRGKEKVRDTLFALFLI